MKRIAIATIGAALLPLMSMLTTSAAAPNLLVNSDFSNGLQGWFPVGGDPRPERAGWVVLTNSYKGSWNTYGGIAQCVSDAHPGHRYTLSAIAHVPITVHDWGGAALHLQFFSSADCSGSATTTESAIGGFFGESRSTRLPLLATAVAPKGTKSVRAFPAAAKHPAPDNSLPEDVSVAFSELQLTEQVEFTTGPGNVEFKGGTKVEIPKPDVAPEQPEPQQPEQPEPEVPAVPDADAPGQPDTQAPQQPAAGEQPSTPGDPIKPTGQGQPNPSAAGQSLPQAQGVDTEAGPASAAAEPGAAPDETGAQANGATGTEATDTAPLPPATGADARQTVQQVSPWWMLGWVIAGVLGGAAVVAVLWARRAATRA